MGDASGGGGTRKHIRGLDSLRFVLAAWVVLGHTGYLPFEVPRRGAWLLVRGVLGNLVSGPAAVIAFFVISGLCIHYANRRVASVRVLPFYVRRELRIVPPVVAAIAIAWAIHYPVRSLHDSTLWSLICEEIYYFLYPLLLVLFRRVGLRRLVVASFVLAYVVVLAVPTPDGNYPDFGWMLTWVVGLPCWLLGCELAEQIDDREDARRATSAAAMWRMRGAVLAASVVCSMLRFHSPLTYPWTLDVFAILCFVWIRAEIFYYGSGERRPRLEALGAGSYSVYLVHPVAISAWWGYVRVPSLGLRLAFVFAIAYAFYRVFEKPSHRLARLAYDRMVRRRAEVPAIAVAGRAVDP